MLQLMEDFLERLIVEELELLWTQVWLIWNQWNTLLDGGKLKSLSSLNKRVEECIEDFKHAQT